MEHRRNTDFRSVFNQCFSVAIFFSSASPVLRAPPQQNDPADRGNQRLRCLLFLEIARVVAVDPDVGVNGVHGVRHEWGRGLRNGIATAVPVQEISVAPRPVLRARASRLHEYHGQHAYIASMPPSGAFPPGRGAREETSFR